MEHIKNYKLDQLERRMEELGEPAFRARQLFKWLYQKNATSFSKMTDIPVKFRETLGNTFSINSLRTIKEIQSSDGSVKFLFETRDFHVIESVWIPDPPRYTLCVSSQVGCAMACAFCATGKLGLKRNLDPGEIVEQVCLARRSKLVKNRITNIVFMGMGEPLANYENLTCAIGIITENLGLQFSPRRLTVSTAGLVPQLQRLGKEGVRVNLAVSLNATTDATRNLLMPVNKTYPLKELLKTCREFPLPKRKRITFEYILIEDVNDSTEDAKRLVRLLKGQKAKVNLIPLNPHPETDFRRPPDGVVKEFQKVLFENHITAIIRESRGEDIGAACGQLGSSYMVNRSREVCEHDASGTGF